MHVFIGVLLSAVVSHPLPRTPLLAYELAPEHTQLGSDVAAACRGVIIGKIEEAKLARGLTDASLQFGYIDEQNVTHDDVTKDEFIKYHVNACIRDFFKPDDEMKAHPPS